MKHLCITILMFVGSSSMSFAQIKPNNDIVTSLEERLESPVKDSLKGIFDAEWSKTLNENKGEFMKLWNNENFYKDPEWIRVRPIIVVAESEKLSLNCIPFEVFEIDSTSFLELNSETSLQSVLKLKKDKVSCYLLKNNNFIVVGRFVYENNRWRLSEIGLLPNDKDLVLQLFRSNKNIRFVCIYVQYPGGYKMEHNAYYENSELWMISYNEKKPLKETIIGEQRKFVNSWY